MLNGRQWYILKDDECSTNVLSTNFTSPNRHLLYVCKFHTVIEHPDKNNTEHSNELVLNDIVQIGHHTYTSNWTVVSSRYDVILGMPWHKQWLTNIKPYQSVENIFTCLGTSTLPTEWAALTSRSSGHTYERTITMIVFKCLAYKCQQPLQTYLFEDSKITGKNKMPAW